MDLRSLNDEELEWGFHHAVKTERKIMHEVIAYIQEVSRRELHLARGHSNLFKYLVKVMKYSEPSARRRLSAARLVTELPALATQLQSGDLNLTQIGDITRAVNLAERTHEQTVSTSEKAELVQQVLGQNSSTTQQLCALVLDIPVEEGQKIVTQKNESRRLEITLTKE